MLFCTELSNKIHTDTIENVDLHVLGSPFCACKIGLYTKS